MQLLFREKRVGENNYKKGQDRLCNCFIDNIDYCTSSLVFRLITAILIVHAIQNILGPRK